MMQQTDSVRPRILVIDDDTSMLQLFARLLPDCDVSVTPDPHEALGSNNGFDLVISDYMMPSMTGDELLGRLRAQNPALKTLLVTAHADILDAEAPEWWSLQPHLAKPVAPGVFRETVTGLIAA